MHLRSLAKRKNSNEHIGRSTLILVENTRVPTGNAKHSLEKLNTRAEKTLDHSGVLLTLIEAWVGIEPAYKGFADPCLTTWRPGQNHYSYEFSRLFSFTKEFVNVRCRLEPTVRNKTDERQLAEPRMACKIIHGIFCK